MEQPRREPGGGTRQPGPAAYLGHGLTWAASTLLFLWLGTRADAWLDTDPWLALVGAFVGAGAGFYHMVHHLLSDSGPGRPGGGDSGEGA